MGKRRMIITAVVVLENDINEKEIRNKIAKKFKDLYSQVQLHTRFDCTDDPKSIPDRAGYE